MMKLLNPKRNHMIKVFDDGMNEIYMCLFH